MERRLLRDVVVYQYNYYVYRYLLSRIPLCLQMQSVLAIANRWHYHTTGESCVKSANDVASTSVPEIMIPGKVSGARFPRAVLALACDSVDNGTVRFPFTWLGSR